LWRTPSALWSGFGCKKQDIGMDLSLFLEKNFQIWYFYKKSSFFVIFLRCSATVLGV